MKSKTLTVSLTFIFIAAIIMMACKTVETVTMPQVLKIRLISKSKAKYRIYIKEWKFNKFLILQSKL